MRLFLIQCCKAKDGRRELFTENRSVLDELPAEQRQELVDLRARVRRERPNAFGGVTLSALALYTGFLYGEATKRFVGSPPADTRFLVLSGGYGLLRPDEVIEDYNVHMDESYSVWKEGLGQVLGAYVRENGISSVHGVVSRTGRYKDLLAAAQRDGVPVTIHAFRYVGGGAQRAVPLLQAKLLRKLITHHTVDSVDGVPVERN